MVGARLLQYLKYKSYKITQLASMVGISQGSLSDILNGNRDPRGATLESIIKGTDINAHWLLTGEGHMTRTAAEEIYAAGEVNEPPQKYPSRNMSDATKAVLDKVTEIMESEDEGTRLALQQNVHMFHEKIEEHQRLKRLEQEVDTLKKALGYVTLPGNSGKAGEGT